MFKNLQPQGTNDTSKSWATVAMYYCSDTQGNSLFWYVGFAHFVNLIITAVSFFPFKQRYDYEVLMKDLAAEQASQDVQNNDTEASTCIDGLD